MSPEYSNRQFVQLFKSVAISYEFLGYRELHRQDNGMQKHWIALDFKVCVDREKAAKENRINLMR